MISMIDSAEQDGAGFPEAFFKQYYPRLCDFAKRFLTDTDEAEDVVQDAFVVYLEQQTTVDAHPAAVKSFLYTTVKNACLNRLRHDKVKTRYCEEHPTAITDNQHVLTAMIQAEVVGEIHQAMRSLPEGCALVLRLGYLEGLKNPQIAAELGISVNTVKSQKQRGLSLLREQLTPQAMLVLMCLLPFS